VCYMFQESSIHVNIFILWYVFFGHYPSSLCSLPMSSGETYTVGSIRAILYLCSTDRG
jgi:hypothetical protein